MTPLIVFMIIAVVLTYVLIRMNRPARCRLAAAGEGEGFADVDLQSCPAGTTQYHDKNDDSKCCEGQVVGRECRGATVCRLSPTADPDAPPYCADYVASTSFNLKGSQIQNPDTGLCLSHLKNDRGNYVLGKTCDGSETWTKNAVGQIVHDKSGLCLQRTDEVFGHFYTLEKCTPIPEQTFKYDIKVNTLQSSAKDSQQLFIQKLKFNDDFLVMEKASYVDWKNYFIKKNKLNPKDVKDEELKNTYKMFYSDMNMPSRSTFLSLQPSMTDIASKIHGMFGSGAGKK